MEFFLDLHALSRRSSKDRFLLVGVFIDLLEAGPQRPYAFKHWFLNKQLPIHFVLSIRKKLKAGPLQMHSRWENVGGWWVVDGGWVGEWAGGWVSGGGRGLSWDMFASCHMPHIIDYYIILLLYIIFWKMSCPPRGFGLETSVLWTRILIDLKKRLPSKKFSHSLWVGICPWFRVFACWNMQTCNVFICASDACPKDVDPLYAELCGRGIRPGIPWWKCLCQVFACWSCCFPSRTPTQNARHRIDDAWAVISKDSWRPSHNSTMPCDTTGRYWNQCFAWWVYQ